MSSLRLKKHIMTLQRAAVVVPHLKNGKMRVIAGRQIMDNWKRNQVVWKPYPVSSPTTGANADGKTHGVHASTTTDSPGAVAIPELPEGRIKYQIKCYL